MRWYAKVSVEGVVSARLVVSVAGVVVAGVVVLDDARRCGRGGSSAAGRSAIAHAHPPATLTRLSLDHHVPLSSIGRGSAVVVGEAGEDVREEWDRRAILTMQAVVVPVVIPAVVVVPARNPITVRTSMRSTVIGGSRSKSRSGTQLL